MKASWYAEALYGALEGKSESDGSQVLARFRAVLAARGHSAFLRFIPQELGKIIEREKNKNEVILVTADSKSLSKWVHAYDHYEKEGIIPKRATRRDVIDESIVGGFQIRANDILIDGSYKKSLVELYRQITNS
ncbi:MAG: F0F1 ATP synthase subunit delta [Minisyncoccia bacterium]